MRAGPRAFGSVRLTNSGQSDATVSIAVWIQTSRHLKVVTSEMEFDLGSPVDFAVLLSNPGSADVVRAELVDRAGSATPIDLTPTANGRWIGRVTPTVGGDSRIHAWTTGDRPRFYSAPIQVASGTVTIGPGFSESLGYIDPDGFLEQGLMLSITVSVEEAGRYEISAVLTDRSGVDVTTAQMNSDSSWPELNAGRNTVELVFRALGIYRSGKSGPYHLARVIVRQYADGYMHYEARVADMGVTQAYDVNQFAPEAP